jgi:hypothetical protein
MDSPCYLSRIRGRESEYSGTWKRCGYVVQTFNSLAKLLEIFEGTFSRGLCKKLRRMINTRTLFQLRLPRKAGQQTEELEQWTIAE